MADGRAAFTPIDLGADGDVVTVVIYASGLRGQYDIRDVRVVVDGLSLPVEFADRYSQRPGLEAVSFILPRALAGRRTVDVVLTAGREVSNPGHLVIR